MNYIEQVKNHFLAKNGYYFKKEETPSYDSPAIDFLLKAEIEDNLDCIERHLRTIKKIAVAFAAISAVSLVVSFIFMISIIFR